MDIYLTGNHENQLEELRYNTWEISFDYELIKQLTLSDLKKFIFDLINKRSEQFQKLRICGGATFYL